jgi:hypothetical protein
MTVKIPYEKGDDKNFLSALNGFVYQLTEDLEPKEVYAIRINDWFDHKLLGYSGRGIIQFPYSEPYILAKLDKRFLDRLTFPPFNPNQVLDERYWELQNSGIYSGTEKTHCIYSQELKYNSYNWHNLVESVSSSGVFIWFSSNSEDSERGSIMVYAIEGDEVQTWYASLSQESGWDVENEIGFRSETAEKWFFVG